MDRRRTAPVYSKISRQLPQLTQDESKASQALPKRKLIHKARPRRSPERAAKSVKPGTLLAYTQKLGFNRPLPVLREKKPPKVVESMQGPVLLVSTDKRFLMIDCSERRLALEKMYTPDCYERRQMIIQEVKLQSQRQSEVANRDQDNAEATSETADGFVFPGILELECSETVLE